MKLVTVAIYYEPTPAWIALNQLKSEGVLAVLENESLIQNVWVLGEAAGHIRLNVAEHDSKQAYEILQQGSAVDATELDKMAMESIPAEEGRSLYKHFYPDQLEEGDELPDEFRDYDASEGLKDVVQEPQRNARELLVDRALRGSLVSFLFIPLSLLVTYVLFQVMTRDEPLDRKYQKKLGLACLFHLPLLVLTMILLRGVLQSIF